MNPINGRPGSHYNGCGEYSMEVSCETNPQRVSICKAKFLIYVVNEAIQDARAEIFGDPITMAAGTWCAQEIVGYSIVEALNRFGTDRIEREIDAPTASDGCVVVSKAVERALYDYLEKSNT